jgi:hypothetical protein
MPTNLTAQALIDGAILVRTWVEKTTGERTVIMPDDMLVLDTRNGTVLRRLAIPDPTPGAPATAPPVMEPSGNPGSDDAYDYREATAVTPQGVLLRHHRLSGGIELELMDPQTGELTVATHADDPIDDLRPAATAADR